MMDPRSERTDDEHARLARAFVAGACDALDAGHRIARWSVWLASTCTIAACGGVVGTRTEGAGGSVGKTDGSADGQGSEQCFNDLDDDGDKLVDCDDPDCTGSAACGARYGAPYEVDCGDGVDDDGDGMIDCKDSDCVQAQGCKQ